MSDQDSGNREEVDEISLDPPSPRSASYSNSEERESISKEAIIIQCKDLIAKLRSQLLEEKANYSNAQKEIVQLRDIISQQDEDDESIRKIAQDMSSRYEEIQIKAQVNLEDLEEKNRIIADMKGQISKLRDVLGKKDILINTMKQEIEGVIRIKESYSQAIGENSKLKDLISERDQQLDALLQNIQDTQQFEEMVKSVAEDMEKSRKALKACEEEKLTLINKIASLEKANNELTSRLSQSNKDMEKSLKVTDSLQLKVEEQERVIDSQLSELKSKNENIYDLQKNLDSLNKALSLKVEEIRAISRRSTDKTSELKSLHAELVELRSSSLSLQKKNETLKQKVDDLITQLNVLHFIYKRIGKSYTSLSHQEQARN